MKNSNILGFDEYQQGYYTLWQKRMLKICWFSFIVIFATELCLIPIYSTQGVDSSSLWRQVAFRVLLPTLINLVTVLISTLTVNSKKISQKRKNFTTIYCTYIMGTVVAFFHSNYQILLLMPLAALLFSIIYGDPAFFKRIAITVFFTGIVLLVVWIRFVVQGNIALVMGTAVIAIVVYLSLIYFGHFVLLYVRAMTEYSYRGYRDRGRTITEAGVDELTDLYNGISFTRALSRCIELFKETGEPLILMLIDIDHAGNINADYGLDNGNEVLKTLARLLKDIIEDNEDIFRQQGDSFAVIFSNQSFDEVQEIANTVCSSFAAVQFNFGDRTPSFTVSAGIARYFPGMSNREFFDDATEALYKAKVAGRNRVAVSEQSASL